MKMITSKVLLSINSLSHFNQQLSALEKLQVSRKEKVNWVEYLLIPGKGLLPWLDLHFQVYLDCFRSNLPIWFCGNELQGSSITKFPTRDKEDICTIMYTSGTTGDPKGVLLTNGAILAEILSTEEMLQKTDKVVILPDYLIDDSIKSMSSMIL